MGLIKLLLRQQIRKQICSVSDCNGKDIAAFILCEEIAVKKIKNNQAIVSYFSIRIKASI